MRVSNDRIVALHRPARAAEGLPETMVIVHGAAEMDGARSFVAAEPYNLSGQAFESVTARVWSQILPSAASGALDAAIQDERR